MNPHCCEDMRRNVELVCEQHADRYECPDCLIVYSDKLREYGIIIHDGGGSMVTISYCPWCGAKLPESLARRWFEELERLGLEPGDDAIPDEYRTASWWETRGL